jgi:putative FmdB family regulatory protein
LITYNYECGTCAYKFSIRRGIKEPILRWCPECGQESLATVIHAVDVIDTTPRTIGGQADKNHAKAGAYEREARHREIELARQRARAENLPEGMSSLRNPNPKPTWWRPGRTTVRPELLTADPRAKLRYMETGRI